jgi:hypothetical protein
MNKSLSCNLCDYTYRYESEIKRHLLRNHNIGIIWHRCDIDDCNAKFKEHHTLKRHKTNIHDIEVTWYHCDIDECEYKCKSKECLKQHKSSIHNIDVTLYHCHIGDCKFKCKSKGCLKQHKSRIHNIDVTWYHCHIGDCKSKFKTNSELKQHKRRIHNIDVSWHYCDIDDCKSKFKTNSELKQHAIFIHDIDVVWHYCDIGECNAKFKHNNLKQHKKICTGTDTILSYGEYKIKEMLDQMIVDYTHDKTHYPLTQFCGKPLRPDFLIEKDSYRPIIIEYHGIQHVKPTKFGSQTEEDSYLSFLKQQEHDQIKRDFCKENDYHLVEIYYTDNSNIDLLVIGTLVKYHDWSETDFF